MSGFIKTPDNLYINLYSDDADVTDEPWNIPLPPSSVNKICIEHTLEYLNNTQVLQALREWHRILASQGRIFLNVPDLEWRCRRWLTNPASGPHLDAIFGDPSNHWGSYQTGFSEQILAAYIRQAGFSLICLERSESQGLMTLSAECAKLEGPNLCDVSLIAVDSVYIDSTVRAMKHCLERANFKNAFLFTDQKPELPDSITRIPIPNLGSISAYSEFMIKDLPSYREMFGGHILVVQHDGFIVDSSAWSEEFLQYDYIGAPWSDRVIGNGGFSLRSRRLLDALAFLNPILDQTHPEDHVIGRTYRHLIENEGILFAPLEIAGRFSVENVPYIDSFGYHGKNIEVQTSFSMHHTDVNVRDLYNRAVHAQSDIHAHVPTLYSLASQCEHVTEICERTRESTAAFLHASPCVFVSYNTDGALLPNDLKTASKTISTEFVYLNASSLDIDLEPTDLLFIDNIHEYEHVRKELDQHSIRVTKFIVLHDTDTFGEKGDLPGSIGIWPAIQEFVDKNPHWRIQSHVEHNNGFTVLSRVSEID